MDRTLETPSDADISVSTKEVSVSEIVDLVLFQIWSSPTATMVEQTPI